MGGENKKISKEEVIAKLKDDGDFDELRLKIVRKLKDNEQLRNNVIAAVKQSAALNRPGAESLKLRQLSDAIHDEVGNKVMDQISGSLWEIIRSEGGMKSEITETVQSVYDKLSNPHGEEKGEAYIHETVRAEKGSDNKGTVKATARRVDETLCDAEPIEPQGFTLSNNSHSNHRQQQQHKDKQKCPRPCDGVVQNCKEELCHSQVGREEDDVGAPPPGFSEDIVPKQSGDVSDEDPDVPPGFG